jgi:YegS/Rv2252/BmrU family lipid kinase
MKHIFILNGNIKNHPFENVIHEVMKYYDYEIVRTQGNDTDLMITKQFKHSRIYSVGGDGMLNIVLQGMVHSDNELVIIPDGTGNDFYRCFGKEKNLRKILENSLKQEATLIDCAKINDRYYINTACFGLDSVIANTVHDGINIKFLNKQSYIITILKRVFKYKARHVKLYNDQELLYDGLMIICTINNGQYFGGGFQITPKASITDGILDVCVVDKISLLRLVYLLILLVLHKLDEKKDVHFFQTNHIYIESKYSCNIDGEEVQYDCYEIKMIPKSINLVI